jgi:hypothetical protein
MSKNSFVSVILCVCAALILSCSGGEGGGASSSPASPPAVSAPPAPVPERPQTVPGVILSRATLWRENDGLMTPASVQVNTADIIGWRNEVKTAVRSTDKASREYALIEVDGKDYWVQSVFVAGDAVPGVIIGEEAVRYARADVRSPNPNGLVIPIYSLVAVHTGQESDLFTGVSAYYLEGERAVLIKNEFIKKENVSTQKADVDGMQLYTLARDAKTDVAKRELLRSALDTGSRFHALIEAELYEEETAQTRERPAADNRLTGTKWNLVYEEHEESTYERSYEIEFLAGGALKSNIQEDQTPDNDFWYYDGGSVVFTFNDEYASYVGYLTPDGLIKGTAKNITGLSWEFECIRLTR